MASGDDPAVWPRPCLFRDRSEAAHRLLALLSGYRGQRPLVLAIPRGAVPMGQVIARGLGGTLDLVLVRKLRAPQQHELAVGAVTESGWTYVAEHAAGHGATPEYLATEKQLQLALLRARRARYTPQRAPLPIDGHVVIVVDDGLATGATMLAALHSIRTQGPSFLACAVPVASPEAAEKVRPLVDALVCLAIDPGFQSVAAYYREFPQVEDAEVSAVLAETAGYGACPPQCPSQPG